MSFIERYFRSHGNLAHALIEKEGVEELRLLYDANKDAFFTIVTKAALRCEVPGGLKGETAFWRMAGTLAGQRLIGHWVATDPIGFSKYVSVDMLVRPLVGGGV